MPRRPMLALVLLSLAAAACGPTSSAPSAGPSTGPSQVSTPSAVSSPGPTPSPQASATPSPSGQIDPANFGGPIDNPWFPLLPGTTFTYHGTKDGEPAVDIYAVTAETKVIDGVTCTIVRDRLTLTGVLAERTVDYYVQDREGNVWYFGEDTEELDATGKVTSTEGSWHAGVDGAIPGVYMEANPTIGHSYPQEFYKGHAEDHFEVVSLSASVKVPFGSFNDAVMTKEWTPLEPAVLDNKYYVRDLGEVREVAVKGPVEELLLVKVDRP
jgi:hypothetical protein